MRSAVLFALLTLVPACARTPSPSVPAASPEAIGGGPPEVIDKATSARDLQMAWLACAVGGGWAGALDRPPHTWSPPSMQRCHALASYLGVTVPKLRNFVPRALEQLRVSLLARMDHDQLDPTERADRLTLFRLSTAAAHEHADVEAAIGRVFRGESDGRAAVRVAPTLGRHTALEELVAFARDASATAPRHEAAALAWLLAAIRTDRARVLAPESRALAVQPVLFVLEGQADPAVLDDPDRVLEGLSARLRERAEALPPCELRGVSIGFAAALTADLGARRRTAQEASPRR